MWYIIEVCALLILASVVSAILLKSAITMWIFERDNPCGYDDFDDFEITEEPKRYSSKKGAIYE